MHVSFSSLLNAQFIYIQHSEIYSYSQVPTYTSPRFHLHDTNISQLQEQTEIWTSSSMASTHAHLYSQQLRQHDYTQMTHRYLTAACILPNIVCNMLTLHYFTLQCQVHQLEQHQALLLEQHQALLLEQHQALLLEQHQALLLEQHQALLLTPGSPVGATPGSPA